VLFAARCHQTAQRTAAKTPETEKIDAANSAG